ncbi:MAG: GreA/GreB family elongation factor [Clostridia bacterium]|nr:GreA/GreB family elongation factor [Clostridia bacterium]
MKKYYITRNGKEKLHKEYLNIDEEITKTNLKMGESVKMDNDLRENPDFMALRVKSMYELPKKKQDLWEKYNNCIVIEEMPEYINFDGETVIMGSRIKINFEGDIVEYDILGSGEGDIDNNILSCDAPIPQVLIGKKVNETVDFNGCKITIIEVTRI